MRAGTTGIGMLAGAALLALGLPARPASPSPDIAALAGSLWPEASRAGVPRALYDATFASLTPDPAVLGLTRRQPEEAKSLGAYLAGQVTPGRVATGAAMRAKWAGPLDAAEARWGVPAALVVALWGLETNYGTATGGKDVVRSLATLAAANYRPELYRAETVAALVMLARGEVARPALRGSWAGAMGQPQFMPSSYEAYAADGDGDGRRDIWTSVPDTLASIANFIRAKGWQPGRPWGLEVAVPAGLDPALGRGDARDWTARGVRRADGAPLPPDGGAMALFYPAGRGGPAFLVTPNYEVIKAYNFSDAYAVSAGHLADRIAGGGALRAAWPAVTPLNKAARVALQARLAALGLPVDNREGRISLALRDTIRLAQARVGLVPDGFPTAELLARLGVEETR